MKESLMTLGIAAIVALSIVGCSTVTSKQTPKSSPNQSQSINNSAISNVTDNTQNQTGQSSTSKNDTHKRVIFIEGTVESVNIKPKYAILRVKIEAIPKVKSNGDNVSISPGDVVSILFNGNLSEYGPGGRGQKPILEVKQGVQMATQMTYHPHSNGVNWTSSFDGYLFKKNGVYLNWKGQSFGSNLSNLH